MLTVALLLAGAGAWAACSDSTGGDTPREVLGAPVQVAGGTARTYAVKRGDQVTALGIRLSDGALTGLPATPTSWTLPLPEGMAHAPWDHATVDWNPQGHDPAFAYGVPHFDFHLYAISTAEQMAIAPGPDTDPVPAANVPQDYVSGVFSVPMMGVHWSDSLAVEFHGQPFTRTFIYGFSHGKLVFVEPMITLAYLQSHPAATVQVKQPQAFQASGLYPGAYTVRYDAAEGATSIVFDSLASH
jgi:hypothetical protein